MKKLFVIALAAVGMVACVNDEIIETPQGNAISFDNAFIDNATRAELTAANLDAFKVWGYIDADGTQVSLFEGDEVSKASGDWTYGDGARYWAPDRMHYFQAIAPLTTDVAAVHANGEVSAINYTVDGDSDLIYAAYNKVGAAAGETNGPVSFIFGHLLSRVNFKFENGFAPADGIEISIKDLQMTVPASGKYTIDTNDVTKGEWSVNTTATGTTLDFAGTGLDFGPKFVLPYDNSYAYDIKFKVVVKYNGTVINTVSKTSSVMVALNKGTAYKFTATINAETLNMESIDFEVGQVGGWITGDDSTLATAYISTADALWAALGNSGVDTIVLTDDINLNEATTRSVTDPVMTVAAGKTVTIDLNSKTLSSTSSSTGKNYNMFDVRGNLTVKNGTMEYKHIGNNMAWNNFAEIFYVGFNGTLNLDGVTAKNLGGSDMAYVIDMVNATNITVNVKNSTLESTYIPIRVFNNNTTGVHNVTIKKSTLSGKYCFWVQCWLADGRDEATLQNTLKLDIFNKAGESNNTFTCTNVKNVPILYGYNEYVYIDQYGEEIGAVVSNTTELKAAVAAGKTSIHMKAGTYDAKDFQFMNKTLTLKGAENGVKIYISQDNAVAYTSFDGCTVTFENLTIETLGGIYKGFARMAATYKNCTIVNNYFTFYGKHVFEGCTFDATAAGNEHCVWTYGAAEVEFVGCEFNYSDRCVNVYVDNQNNTPGITQAVKFTECEFNTTNTTSQGAVEVNSSPFTAGVTVTLNECDAPAYGEMVYVSPWDGTNGATATITVDGELKSIQGFGIVNGYYVLGNTVTVLNGEGFKTVATTILADPEANVVVELANDIDLAGIEWPAVCAKATFVLDGKGKAIKNLTTSAVEEHGFSSTAMFTTTRKATTIKNLVVENATVTGNGQENSHGAILVACNYAALTIQDVNVVDSTISNCDRTGGLLTYLYFTEATVDNCLVDGCTINSIGTAGAILGMNNSNNFTMTNCEVVGTTVSSSEGSNKAGILIGTWQDAGTLTSSGNTHENSKAINAGVETNNEIGRHA